MTPPESGTTWGPWARTEQGRRYAGNPKTSRYGPRGREQTGRSARGTTGNEMSGDVTLRSARSRADPSARDRAGGSDPRGREQTGPRGISRICTTHQDTHGGIRAVASRPVGIFRGGGVRPASKVPLTWGVPAEPEPPRCVVVILALDVLVLVWWSLVWWSSGLLGLV